MMVPEEKLSKLHDAEKQYLHLYNGILDRYMRRYVPNCQEPLDLTADADAPEDVNVTVRLREKVMTNPVTTASGVLQILGFSPNYVVTCRHLPNGSVEGLNLAGEVVLNLAVPFGEMPYGPWLWEIAVDSCSNEGRRIVLMNTDGEIFFKEAGGQLLHVKRTDFEQLI